MLSTLAVNIFYVDTDPVTAARALCDAHVIKMTVESAQLLSTARHALGLHAPYKATHKKHPCALWVAAYRGNYEWTHAHLVALSDEYTRRFNRVHATSSHIEALRDSSMFPPGLSEPAQAMPDEHKRTDPVEAYRAYYRFKSMTIHRFRYTNADFPRWLYA